MSDICTTFASFVRESTITFEPCAVEDLPYLKRRNGDPSNKDCTEQSAVC